MKKHSKQIQELNVSFIPIKCNCGVELKEEGKDVTRKVNDFTDNNGVHVMCGKVFICFDCNKCHSTMYQVIGKLIKE